MASEGRRPIGGRCAWTGAELARKGDWVRRLDARHVAALAAALDTVDRRRVPTFEISRADFPLPGLDALLDDVRAELEDGRGVVRISGLPVERFSLDGLRRLFWGLATHLGTALNQSARGEMMGEVRDESYDAEKSYVVPQPGLVASSRSRSRSTAPLRFHTDRCDVIALLCTQTSMAGGATRIASIARIHDVMLERRPDLLEVLFQDIWRMRPLEEDGRTAGLAYKMPILGMAAGKLTSQYSRTYVEQAQDLPDVPRLTAAQVEAMDMLAAVADETCLEAPFEPGDLQLMNNHAVYHGRTAFADDRGAGKSRHLLRLWLSVPNNRALPAGFEALWGRGAAAANSLRGGVPVEA
ncbi:MAG: TauD/TfdA family dioxygenase [Alphaproteobacteria bacterium]|nr:TauD/TfdA family dioxygenase [Alphaproteobacteria bacterium]